MHTVDKVYIFSGSSSSIFVVPYVSTENVLLCRRYILKAMCTVAQVEQLTTIGRNKNRYVQP